MKILKFICSRFAIFIASIFLAFVVALQSSRPMIHVLYNRMLKLIKNILDLFLSSKYIMDDRKKLLPADGLRKVDVKNEKTHLSAISETVLEYCYLKSQV